MVLVIFSIEKFRVINLYRVELYNMKTCLSEGWFCYTWAHYGTLGLYVALGQLMVFVNVRAWFVNVRFL